MKKNKNATNNRKSNIILALIFTGLVLGIGANYAIGEKTKIQNKEIEQQLYSDYSLISAKAVSDVVMEKDRNIISYLVDVDYNNDGEKDGTITLINKVKYVSDKRKKEMEKIKKGSKLVFECNVKTDFKVSHETIMIKGEEKTISLPKTTVSSISGHSAVGLIDHLLVVDGEIIGNARREVNREYLDFLDIINGSNDKFGTEAKDKKIDNKVFENFYETNLRAR